MSDDDPPAPCAGVQESGGAGVPARGAEESSPYADLVRQLVAAGATSFDEGFPCSYLPGRLRRQQCVIMRKMPGLMYHDLMDYGFRRAGYAFYRPRCEGCAACTPIRIPVGAFVPSRSQRRVGRHNRDVTMDVAPGGGSVGDEELAVYQRYLAYQHPGTGQGSERESLEDFLYRDYMDTIEVSYRVDGRLMGVSILDVCERSWSSVYHFFEPDFARRSPGVFSVLAEIEMCKRIGVPYYYLGYWIAGCPTMVYKANYRPCEVLVDGVWQDLAPESTRGAV